MAIELLSETPSLLKERHVVHFSKGWPEAFRGKYFRVVQAPQQIHYEAAYIISAGSGNTFDVDFDKPPAGDVTAVYKSLIPEQPDSLYEILIGLKGLVVLFPRYNNSYFNQLETSNVVPDPADTRRKFLGSFSYRDSPYWSPRLREYTVQKQQPPQLRLFNDMPNEERVVLHFLVNRCRIEAAPDAQLTQQDKERARSLTHHDAYKW